MTRKQWLEKILENNMSYSTMWSGKTEQNRFDNIFCYYIFSKTGYVITSVIIKELDEAIFVYFANEKNSFKSDLEKLEKIAN